MKTHAVASRSKANRSARALPAVRAARPAGSAHERQADQRAAGFLRGERGLSAGLSVAPAAGLAVPGSAAESLPGALRAMFEVAFAADLSSVRIHRDAPAQAAAAGFGAQAFASGVDLFFAANAWAPGSERGRALLAHELTHVLQQTGRRAADGRLRAAPVSGSAMPQFSLEYKVLRSLHGAADSSVDFRKRADEIQKAASAGAGALTAYVEAHWNELGTWPASAVGLLFDNAKWLDLHDLAARLIERDNYKGGLPLRTAWYSSGVKEALAKRASGMWVFQRAIEYIPDLKLYRSEWLRLVEGYLFQRALADPVPLVRNADPAAGAASTKWQKISDHQEEIRTAYGSGTTVVPTEWYYEGLSRLRALDDLRIAHATSRRDAAAGWSADELVRRRHRIDGVRKLAAAVRAVEFQHQGTADKELTDAWRPFHEKLADAVAAIAEKVQAQWESFDEFRARLANPAKHGAPRASQLQAIVTLATSSNLSRRLVEAIVALNASEKGGARIPVDYVTRCFKHGEAIEKVLRKHVDEKLQGWFRAGQTEKVNAGLWLIAEVWPVRDLVQWQQPPFGTPAGVGPSVQVLAPGAAEITAHRIAVARRLAALAPMLRSDELATRAADVTEARLEAESQLALLPDETGVLWHQDVVSREKVQKDFNDVPLKGPTPVTPHGWLLLYEADYLERLRIELALRLPAGEAGEKGLVGQGGMPSSIIGTASKTVRQQMQGLGMTPQRWAVPEDGRHVYFAGRRDGKDFAKLLFDQLAKETFYTDARALGLTPIVPDKDVGRAFVWFWPQYPVLVALLRQIALYNELVAMARFGARDDAALKKTAELEDAPWSETLGQVMDRKLDPKGSKEQRFSTEELVALSAAVNAFFKQYMDKREGELADPFMRATRIDRMRWAAFAEAQLALYEADRHRTLARDDTFERLQRFYLSLLVVFRRDTAPAKPDEPQGEIRLATDSRPRLHLAALMLEIAPTMHRVFERERSGAFIQTYLGLIEDGHASATWLASRPAAERAAYLHSDENSDAWLSARLTQLSTVVDRFRVQRRTTQLRAGFSANAQDQTLKVQMSFSSALPMNETIHPRTGYGVLGSELTGKHYRVLAVYREFVYHPAFGEDQVQTMRSTRSGYGAPMLLAADDATPLADTSKPLLSVVEVDDKDLPIGQPFDVAGTEADYPMLAQIYSGALYWAFASSMANIEAGIERYVNTLLDLAELIPGWGTLITAGRVVAAIGEFWAEGTYEDMLRVINGDTREMLEGLLGKLAEVADPAALIELLLFGNPTLNRLLASSTVVNAAKSEQAMARRPEARRSKLGSLKKTFAALQALGRRFAKALEGLHERVQQPMQDARIYSSTRPALSGALQFAASHVYEIAELMTAGAAVLAMVDPQERQSDPSAVDRYRAMLGDEQAQFGQKIHAIVGRLATLELPEKVVDITGAVQFIIAEMIAFVGKRLGLQGKAVIIILQGSGALDYFAGKVAHEIVARGFDPNVYWRDEVIPQVSDSFNSARDSLVKSLNDLLAKPAFDQMFTPIGKGDPIVLEPDAAARLPEVGADTQPAPAEDRSLVPRPARVPAVGAGSPLPDGARTELEAGFGSDLRHVRLHDGGEGEAMTAAFGADALTSGSHVFLRGGLHAERGRGREVMQHEVAHVLQQTGPRAPGSTQPAVPAPARPERGLMVDPASETEAHRMAAEVRARLGGGAPATGVAARAVAGMQPYTVKDLDPYLLARSLRALNRLEQIKAQEAVYEKDKTQAKLDRTEDTGAIGTLVKAFSAVTRKSSQLVVKAPKVFRGRIDAASSSSAGTLDKILAELDKNLDARHLEVVASHIAKEAQDLIPQPKTKGRKTPTPKTRYVNPSHFGRQLEGYVLGKTGVALALGIKTRDFKAPDGSNLKEIDPGAPLASIEVLHLYLPYVAPNSDLAVFAITNTWPDARTDDKRRAKLAATVRGSLVGMGIRATVWALFGDAYKFSILFKKQVDDLMTANLVAGGPLDPNLLPRPEAYANSGLTSKPPSHIGTRVATYADPNQIAQGRHSHHLTQFLVAEYFANRNDGKQPFQKNAKLPGVSWSKGMVTHISPDPVDKTKGIQVADTYGSDSSRGGPMPAISLAASTHQSGDLHITPAPDDLGGSVKKTQAYAVDTTFRSGLPEPLQAANYASRYAAWRKTRTDSDIAQMIHARALVAFRSWTKHMSDRLLANMPRMEVEYYKTLAAGNTVDSEVKAVSTDGAKQAALRKLLEAVAAEAVARNYEQMASKGWTSS